MSDNFENKNGFDSSDEKEEDVFSFMKGGNFYSQNDEYKSGYSVNEEPKEDSFGDTASVYENEPAKESYSSPSFEPEKEEFHKPPVAPYDFSGKYNYNAPDPEEKKTGSGKKIVTAIIVVAVLIGIFSSVKALFSDTSKPENTTTSAYEGTTAPSGDSLQVVPSQNTNVEMLNAVQVAEKAKPSVVGVMTYKNGQLSGEGSGVAMSLDSTGKYTYIITCAHVISDKGVTYGVLATGGKNYEAQLVAYDVRTDIGVLKVETTDIPLAQFGDSKTLRVGETVYAIGNPGGSEFFGSFTDGIISAIDRSVSGTYTMTCLQHSAAINPGNSGGALVNSAGQVIGINSSKIAATDYEGMGFAVPTAIVKPVVDSLIQYGYVPNRPKLGIEYASVSSYQLYSMVVAIKGLPTGSLVIAGISSDSSLANTDAQVGDLIIAVNGKPMDTSDVLLDLITTGAVGDTLTLTLCRVENRTYKTSTFDVTITLVEDRGESEEETTAYYNEDGYYYGGQSSFEEFFNQYFGF